MTLSLKDLRGKVSSGDFAAQGKETPEQKAPVTKDGMREDYENKLAAILDKFIKGEELRERYEKGYAVIDMIYPAMGKLSLFDTYKKETGEDVFLGNLAWLALHIDKIKIGEREFLISFTDLNGLRNTVAKLSTFLVYRPVLDGLLDAVITFIEDIEIALSPGTITNFSPQGPNL